LSFVLTPWAIAQETDWYCKEVSTERQGNLFKTCGVGVAIEEGEARVRALENARKEFVSVCQLSADCKDKPIIAEPQRTSCEKSEGKYHCYRLVNFQISSKGSPLLPAAESNALIDDTRKLLNPDPKLEGDDKVAEEEVVKAPPEKKKEVSENAIEPFALRDLASIPKIRVGMSKEEAFKIFGKPSNVKDSDEEVRVFYKDKPFCYGGTCSFRIDKKTGKIESYSDFRYEYTDVLK